MAKRRGEPRTATNVEAGLSPDGWPRPSRRTAKKPPVRADGSRSSYGAEPPAPVESEIIAVIEARRGAWSAPDLAELLGCSGKHIYALAKFGSLPHIRIGGMIRFDPAATARWLRERFIAA